LETGKPHPQDKDFLPFERILVPSSTLGRFQALRGGVERVSEQEWVILFAHRALV
jgi:hypothetical protein